MRSGSICTKIISFWVVSNWCACSVFSMVKSYFCRISKRIYQYESCINLPGNKWIDVIVMSAAVRQCQQYPPWCFVSTTTRLTALLSVFYRPSCMSLHAPAVPPAVVISTAKRQRTNQGAVAAASPACRPRPQQVGLILQRQRVGALHVRFVVDRQIILQHHRRRQHPRQHAAVAAAATETTDDSAARCIVTAYKDAC